MTYNELMNMNNEPDTAAWTVEELRVELDRYEEDLGTEGKPRNTITSYVYPVDRFLKWLGEPYRPIRAVSRPPVTDRRTSRDIVMMAGEGSLGEGRSVQVGRSRYDGLRTYLSGRSEPQVRLSFAEIERIIGQPLPSSARRHRAWWANERSGSHVNARAWLEATPPRRTANVDLNAETADFVR
jgi:hypothetical protein